jgi:cell wall assembly regulator SMI1
MAAKLYRVMVAPKAKVNVALVRRGLGLPERGFAMPIERLRLGWAAYVDKLGPKEDIAAAKLTIDEQSKPPARVKATAEGKYLLTSGWEQLREFVEKKTKKGERSSVADLNGPALAEDVEAIEKTFKLKLPEDYVAWLALHDGGTNEGGGPFEWAMMSLAMSAHAAHRQQSHVKTMAKYEIDPDEDDRVKPVFWHKSWFPFADSGGGDYKCLDLAPTKLGLRGQVIDWPHDDNRRTVEAPGFYAWIENLLDKLIGGEYVIENGFVIQRRLSKTAKKKR